MSGDSPIGRVRVAVAPPAAASATTPTHPVGASPAHPAATSIAASSSPRRTFTCRPRPGNRCSRCRTTTAQPQDQPRDEPTRRAALLPHGPGGVEEAGTLVARIEALLAIGRAARLVGPDGDEVEIPESVLSGLLRVAAAIASGRAVTVAAHDPELTTQEAADLLRVSRPHLIKPLERGDLPCHRTSADPRAHRRVLLADVMDYRDRRRQTRRQGLRELTRASQAAERGYR